MADIMDPPKPESIEESSASSTHQELVQSLERIGSSLDLTLDFEKKFPIEDIPSDVVTELPDYDRGLVTRRFCIAGLIAAWVSIVGCLILGATVTARVPNNLYLYQTTLTWTSGALVSLIVNVFITFITDAMGYIHGVSLRWVLYREGHLHFNTNLRLFRTSQNYVPNMWPVNIIWIVSLVTCYGASSEMFIRGQFILEDANGNFFRSTFTYVNGIAVLAMAVGLLGMAMVTTWIIFFDSKGILTWSANALNNTLVLLHHNGHRRLNRCMVSLASGGSYRTTNLRKPLGKQMGASVSNAAMKYVIVLIWIWSLMVLICFVLLVIRTRQEALDSVVWLTKDTWAFSFSWEVIMEESGQIEVESWDSHRYRCLEVISDELAEHVILPVQGTVTLDIGTVPDFADK